MTDEKPEPSSPSEPLPVVPGTSRTARAGVAIVCTLIVAVAALALVARMRGDHDRVHDERSSRLHDLAAGPRVLVTKVSLSAPQHELVRVGEAHPFVETPLYAKVSGYLREVRVDRGARVHRGDVLAIIDVPENGPQLRAARADAANRHAIAARDRGLVGSGIVSQQEADVADTSAELADATTRLVDIARGFSVIRAPFDGQVTARYADPGALVQAATGAQTGALPVVRVSDVDHLRVFVYLDQHDVTFVHVGDAATVRVRERPGTALPAAVSRIAGELDPRTRTMLVEVDLDNHAGLVAPGGFVDVVLTVNAPPWPEVPAEALVLRGPSAFLARVTAGRVHLVPVEVVDDDGARARVHGDITPGAVVVLSLPDEVADGSAVQATERRAR